MFSKVEGQDPEGRRLWKVLPSCHLKMTASQIKLDTTSVPVEEAAPALIERIKQVDREGAGHDELHHVYHLRKKYLFIFKEHLLHHIQLAGVIILVKTVEGKTIFKIADGTDIMDCVYWHKYSNIDGKEQRSAIETLRVGQMLVVSGKPEIYRDNIQIYVTRFNLLTDFEQEASFYSSLICSHRTLFERDLQTPSPALESKLYDENVPKHRGFISYMKIRQALVNEFTRNPKLEVGDTIEYQSLKQRLLSIAEKHAFLQKLKENPNVLHQAIEDLQDMGLLKVDSKMEETQARLRVFRIQDLKNELDQAIKLQLQSGNLTFKEMHEQLTLAFSVCLSKETVFERVNALFKLGEIVELEGHGQGALYSLLE